MIQLSDEKYLALFPNALECVAKLREEVARLRDLSRERQATIDAYAREVVKFREDADRASVAWEAVESSGLCHQCSPRLDQGVYDALVEAGYEDV